MIEAGHMLRPHPCRKAFAGTTNPVACLKQYTISGITNAGDLLLQLVYRMRQYVRVDEQRHLRLCLPPRRLRYSSPGRLRRSNHLVLFTFCSRCEELGNSLLFVVHVAWLGASPGRTLHGCPATSG